MGRAEEWTGGGLSFSSFFSFFPFSPGDDDHNGGRKKNRLGVSHLGALKKTPKKFLGRRTKGETNSPELGDV